MANIQNNPNQNREWTAQQLADGAKLVELINAGDTAAIIKAGYAPDSLGQYFLKGVLVPSPVMPKVAGTGVTPYKA